MTSRAGPGTQKDGPLHHGSLSLLVYLAHVSKCCLMCQAPQPTEITGLPFPPCCLKIGSFSLRQNQRLSSRPMHWLCPRVQRSGGDPCAEAVRASLTFQRDSINRLFLVYPGQGGQEVKVSRNEHKFSSSRASQEFGTSSERIPSTFSLDLSAFV